MSDEPDVWWTIGPHEHVAGVLEVWVHADDADHKFCMTRAQADRFGMALRMMKNAVPADEGGEGGERGESR